MRRRVWSAFRGSTGDHLGVQTRIPAAARDSQGWLGTGNLTDARVASPRVGGCACTAGEALAAHSCRGSSCDLRNAGSERAHELQRCCPGAPEREPSGGPDGSAGKLMRRTRMAVMRRTRPPGPWSRGKRYLQAGACLGRHLDAAEGIPSAGPSQAPAPPPDPPVASASCPHTEHHGNARHHDRTSTPGQRRARPTGGGEQPPQAN